MPVADAVQYTPPWGTVTPVPYHALLDSGNRKKLERFGGVTLIRSEPKAWWKPAADPADWQNADAQYEDDAGQWQTRRRTPRSWSFEAEGLTLEGRLTDGTKHVGLFPEQASHWHWMRERLTPDSRILNLFGYTGMASLVAAQAGAKVTHVDASKPAIAWGRDNQQRSSLADKPIRWILDDALKFLRREGKRGSQYDGILLDPPSFGRGPRGEIWKVEEALPELLEAAAQLIPHESKLPSFVLLTMYNLEASALMLGTLLADQLKPLGGTLSVGELCLKEESAGRLLPLSLYGRWEG